MRRSYPWRLALLCAVLTFASNGPAQTTVLPRIVPSGIDGALLVAGRGEVAEPILARFVDVAGGKNGRIAILCFDDSDAKEIPAQAARLSDMARRGSAETSLVRVAATIPESIDKGVSLLKNATGVWLIAMDPQRARDVCSDGKLAAELRSLLKRGGIAGTATASELFGGATATGNQVNAGLGWLPDFLILTPDADTGWFSHSLKNSTALVGCEIRPGAALLVRGRNLEALGTGGVHVHLAASNTRPAEKLALQGRKETDLTLLRRAARDRAAGFPNTAPGEPTVNKGTLVIVGGGRTPPGLNKQFVDSAGGGKAFIVVLPTALPDPIPSHEALAESFRRQGARVVILPARTLAEVESSEYLEAFRKATGIWFSGGRQWRFVDAYEDTKALQLMHEVLQRGGVIGGTSAGASIQAEYLARGSPYGNLEIIAEGYERGLGFLKGVAIDQHFTQRRRHGQMATLTKTFPQFLGIGIDESTALIVRGHRAMVVGQGRAFFYDSRRMVGKGEPDYQAVSAGGEYDLRERRIVPKN